MKDMNLLNSEDIEVKARKKYKSYRIVEKRLFPFAEEPVAVEFAEEPVAVKFAEELVAVKFAEEPVAVKFAEEPVAVEFAEEPVAVEFAEEPVAVEFTEEPVAVEKKKAACDGNVTLAEPTRLLSKFYKKLAVEGFLKSLIISAVISFGVCTLAALATWFFKPEFWWLALLSFGVAMLISVPAFYALRFRPSYKEVAARIDRLGLNERAITMLELEKETSILAKFQREDTYNRIKCLRLSSLKLVVSKAAIIVMACVFACGAGATAVSALSNNNIIPTGGQLIYAEEEVTYFVEYIVEEGGIILGEEVQPVFAGEDSVTVEAVPDENWVFIGWFDAETDEELSTDIYRTEFDVNSDLVIVAKFGEAGEGEPGDGDGDGGGEPGDGEPGDKPSDAPEKGDQDGEGSQGEAPDLPSEGSGAGGGANKEGNNIEDNETPYKELIGEYYDKAMEILQNNDSIPDEIRKMIEEYYDVIN